VRLQFIQPALLVILLGIAASGCTLEVDASDYIAQCEPGLIRCEGTTIQMCSDDGKVFEVIEECTEGSTCLDAACTPLDDDFDEEPPGESTGSDIAGPPTAWTPPEGDPKLGQLFGITAHISIQTAFPGSFVDIGICEGSTVVAIPDHPAACAHSLFLRITRTNHNLEGMFWHHAPENASPVPLETSPIPMDPEDVFVLGWTDYSMEGVPDDSVRISMSLKSLSGISATAFATAELPLDHVQTFGVWNWETDGDEEAVLAGTLSALNVEIVNAPALTVADLLTVGTQTGDFITSGPEDAHAEFFSTSMEVGAIQLPIQEALTSESSNLP